MGVVMSYFLYFYEMMGDFFKTSQATLTSLAFLGCDVMEKC